MTLPSSPGKNRIDSQTTHVMSAAAARKEKDGMCRPVGCDFMLMLFLSLLISARAGAELKSILPDEQFRVVRQGTRFPMGIHAVLPAAPIWRCQGLRLLGHRQIPRELWNLWLQRYSFNHESLRRGETFVTRKISRGVAQIKMVWLRNYTWETLMLRVIGIPEGLTQWPYG